jgi:Immunity protein 21
MKIIQSAGGSLIGLNRDHLPCWSGIAGKHFIGEQSPFPTDYEAVIDLTCGIGRPPVDIAKLEGIIGDGLLITMPFETAIIQSDRTFVYMAQVECAEPDWSFSEISRAHFDKAQFWTQDDVHFHTKACTYLFFDSAYPSEMIEDDYLSFEIEEGDYVFSCAYDRADPRVGLYLYRITRLV